MLIQSDIYIIPQINFDGYGILTEQSYYIKLKPEQTDVWSSIFNTVPFFIPLAEHCIVSESWLQVHFTSESNTWRGMNFRFHRDGMEPAVSVKGNPRFNLYYKNGVLLSPKWFKVPSEKLDAQEILTISNVEQRMEMMRYVGMEMLLSKLEHKVIGKTEDGVYELLAITVDVGGGDRFPLQSRHRERTATERERFTETAEWIYLKMINPSTGTYHIEAVHPTCRTVMQALNWRASELARFLAKDETWTPEQIT